MAWHSRPKDGVLSHAYVPAIHVLLPLQLPEDVDARHKAGHDELCGPRFKHWSFRGATSGYKPGIQQHVRRLPMDSGVRRFAPSRHDDAVS